MHRVLRRPVPDPTLAQKLVESRDFVRTALAESWKQAVPAALGNQLFDFLALYVSLLTVGSRVDPVLVLLAFVAGSALAMIPITPGGLGFVEAGLTGVLTLAGVTPGARCWRPCSTGCSPTGSRCRRASSRRCSSVAATGSASPPPEPPRSRARCAHRGQPGVENSQRPTSWKLSRPAGPAVRHAFTAMGATQVNGP